MAYPTTGKATFNRVQNYVDFVLDTHINPIYDAVEGITDDLIGTGNGTGLKVSSIVSGGSFVYGATQSWDGGLKARLNNMDAGLYDAYVNRVDSRGGVIQSSATTTVGLKIKLLASQTANAFELKDTTDTTTILSIGTTGNVTTSGSLTVTGNVTTSAKFVGTVAAIDGGNATSTY
jgi:hypothetical protein